MHLFRDLQRDLELARVGDLLDRALEELVGSVDVKVGTLEQLLGLLNVDLGAPEKLADLVGVKVVGWQFQGDLQRRGTS